MAIRFDGCGVPKNMAIAYMLFAKAGEAGLDAAITAREKLDAMNAVDWKALSIYQKRSQ